MNKRLMFAAVILAPAALLGSSAFAQDPPQKPPEQHAQTAKAAKTPKVWTDDDMNSLRSPADVYKMQQEEAENQQAAAKAAAKESPYQTAKSGFVIQRPKTVQQADSLIAQNKQLLTSEQEYLQQLKKQVDDPTITGMDKTRIEWRLKSHAATAERAQQNLTQLQAEKDALAKKTAGDKSSSSNDGSGPSQN